MTQDVAPQDVAVAIQDGIQIIRMNRAAKKNALTRDMYDTMTAALKAGDADATVAVHVLMGSGGVFSAGNDIKDFLHRPPNTESRTGGASGFIGYLPLVEKPLVAAVDGLAIGVGTTLLFHCDLVFASPAASLRTPFLDLGLVPEAASSLLAPRRMGHARAFELLCLGETFDAERALQAGLVNKIVPAGELEAQALKSAKQLAAKPPGALAAARKLMKGDAGEILAQIKREGEVFAERLASPEAKEAFNAFLEKRPPDFLRFRQAG
jgi:enoyl-CoA hydratase/carnithine racemase